MNQVKWKKERKSGVKISLFEIENVTKNKVLFCHIYRSSWSFIDYSYFCNIVTNF
jgi:hypothetical protein